MHAVIETGSKQYRVANGDVLRVEKIDGEVGDTVTLSRVLLVESTEKESTEKESTEKESTEKDADVKNPGAEDADAKEPSTTKEVAIGQPLVPGAAVTAKIIDQDRAPKIRVFKKKRRKNYRRTKGHRQYQTVLKIIDIKTNAHS